jgi:hypothetical protein
VRNSAEDQDKPPNIRRGTDQTAEQRISQAPNASCASEVSCASVWHIDMNTGMHLKTHARQE